MLVSVLLFQAAIFALFATETGGQTLEQIAATAGTAAPGAFARRTAIGAVELLDQRKP